MNILAFDTSTEHLSIALQVNDRVSSFNILAGQTHSQRILPKIRELLLQEEIELHALDGIVFGMGPGTFTGLRIGCGVAQGLAFGANLPVVGISTLQAIAAASNRKKVIACLDARMGEIYHAAYQQNAQGEYIEVVAPNLCKAENAPTVLGSDWTGMGIGWQSYEERLLTHYLGQVEQVIADAYPNAETMIHLAVPKFSTGKAKSAEEISPLYLRNKVAFNSIERAQGLHLP